MPFGNYSTTPAPKPSGSKQNMDADTRRRTREAARMIPGVAPVQDARAAQERAALARNSQVSPEAAQQQAIQARLSRLQSMHEQMLAAGNEAEAAEVMAIIESLQGQAAGPGSEIGAMVGGTLNREVARRRNAFAGMGPQR